jgi:hypothetical protein
MMQITPGQVLNALQFHNGQAMGIHVRDLVMKVTGKTASCGVLERRIRTLITELRLAGHAICGHPTAGYYLAATPKELDDTCEFLRHRALSSLQIEARMRRISMPELLGQLSINSEGVPHEPQ